MVPQRPAASPRRGRAAILPGLPTPRVLVVSAEPVGARMAGPAIRAYELARALAARRCDVTLAAPGAERAADGGRACSRPGSRTTTRCWPPSRAHDVVVAQQLPPRLLAPRARRGRAARRRPLQPDRRRGARGDAPSAPPAAPRGCGGSSRARCARAHLRRRRPGALRLRAPARPAARRYGPRRSPISRRRRPPSRWCPSPCLRRAARPRSPASPRAALPAVGPRVLLLGRRVWDWLDAPTVHPGPWRGCPTTSISCSSASGARRCCRATSTPPPASRSSWPRELGLLGRRVHVHDGWVPYAERGAWLLQADVGVSAHPDHLEARFAYRTRLARPLVGGLAVGGAPRGDALGDPRSPARGAGRAVPAGDPAAFAAACAALLARAGRRPSPRPTDDGRGAHLGPGRRAAAGVLHRRRQAPRPTPARARAHPVRPPLGQYSPHRRGDPAHRRPVAARAQARPQPRAGRAAGVNARAAPDTTAGRGRRARPTSAAPPRTSPPRGPASTASSSALAGRARGLSVAVLAALLTRAGRCRAPTACLPPTSSSTSPGSARPPTTG